MWSAKALSANAIAHRMGSQLLINTARALPAIGASLPSQTHADSIGPGPPGSVLHSDRLGKFAQLAVRSPGTIIVQNTPPTQVAISALHLQPFSVWKASIRSIVSPRPRAPIEQESPAARRRDLHTASQRPFRSPRNRQEPSNPRYRQEEFRLTVEWRLVYQCSCLDNWLA